jgi:hypothetical protein
MKTIGMIVAAAVGLALVSLLFVGSFVGALHKPVPHRLPVGVAGPPAAARQLNTAFAAHMPGAFTVTDYPSAAAARAAVLDRDVDAALVPGPGGQQLLVAGAAGQATAQVAAAPFKAEAAAAGQHLAVSDIRPLPSGDPNGIAPLFMYLGLALPGAAFGIALASVLGRRLNWPARLGALALYSILAAAAATWVTSQWTGALPGAPVALGAVGALIAFAVSSACSAAWRLAGPPLAALIVLLLVPVGVPAAGGPIGSVFVPAWYGHLGAALPAGTALPLIRDVVSFGGHGMTGPLTVLALWAVIPAALLAIPRFRPSRPKARAAAGVPATVA